MLGSCGPAPVFDSDFSSHQEILCSGSGTRLGLCSKWHEQSERNQAQGWQVKFALHWWVLQTRTCHKMDISCQNKEILSVYVCSVRCCKCKMFRSVYKLLLCVVLKHGVVLYQSCVTNGCHHSELEMRYSPHRARKFWLLKEFRYKI